MSKSDPQSSTSIQEPGKLYDAEYYKSGCGPIPYERNSHWLNFFGGIADEIVRSLRPSRVFDAGCAWGFLVESLCDRGVDAYGVDLSEFAIRNVRPDMRGHCSNASLAEPIGGGRYDLVTCIEVLEHMPEVESRQAIAQMTQVTDQILFSSTSDDFTEKTHVNVHPVFYWLRAFRELGFDPDLLFDASFIASHAFLVRRRAEPLTDEAVRLFGETLRLRSFRVAFLNRQKRLEELEREVDERERYSRESAADLVELRQTIEQLQSANARLQNTNVELQNANGELQNTKLELQNARVELQNTKVELQDTNAAASIAIEDLRKRNAELGGLVADLQYRMEELKLRSASTDASVAEWMARSSEQSQQLEEQARRYESLQTHLESIHSSPGWKVISRYREWLRRSRFQRPWVRRFWEPGVLWALRHMSQGGAPPVAVLPVASPAVDRPHPATPVSLPAETGYETWIRENEPSGIELEIQRRMSATFSYRPKISILVPVYRVPLQVLRETIESVDRQTYDNWELCLAVGGDESQDTLDYLANEAARDPRILVKILASNQGISGNSNEALSLAGGEYIALLDHDDTLAPFALFEVAQLLNQDPSANFIYSDKDQISADAKQRLHPLFKPEWSPETMLNANYLTHLCVMRTDQLREIGGWRKETDGAQDWDLFLRIVERFGQVRHIPKVLYHWRQISTSVAAGGLDAKPYAAAAQVYSVQAHCEAIGLKGAGVAHGEEGLRVTWPMDPEDRATVIFLAEAPGSETLARATQLAELTKHPNFEILVPMSGENFQIGRVRSIASSAGASLVKRIELAVRSATGRNLVFVDEAVTPAGSEWLTEMTGPLQIPGVGLVGARILDDSSRALRHCGLVFTRDGRLESIYAGQPEWVSEQAGAAGWYRNWSGVSGACFSIRREVWEAVQGMGGDVLYPRLDVNLNLKVQLETDWRIFYNPYARLIQSRDAALEALLPSDRRQAAESIRSFFPNGDPHFNPNLDCRNGKVTYRLVQNRPQARGTDYAADSQVLVDIYDFAHSQVERSRRIDGKPGTRQLESITWFLPDFGNVFYGGVHTIFRFADRFQKAHNVRSQFCILGRAPESRVRRQVAGAFPELAASSRFFALDGPARVNELPATDAAVSTLWTTAYAALEFDKTRRKFYFIQDDEALFYPAGSISALVEATYGFGFRGICNTVSLLESYTARGGEGEYFSPCIDTQVFHDRNRKAAGAPPPYTVFCYGRPGHPRNCFELLASALRILKERLGDRLLLISAGADWDPKDFGLEGVVHNLGLLNYQSTAALYRMCDAGLVMMMTRHPSYLPMELMGCGALVITNRNRDTSWLLKDGENCLLADLSASSLAGRVEEGLRDVALRKSITARAGDLVRRSFSNWDDQVERIYQYMASVS